MATLYVRNVPDEIYQSLKKNARKHHRSIAAEVLSLLETFVPTESELKRRRELLEHMMRINSRKRRRGSFPSTEEMIREDRNR